MMLTCSRAFSAVIIAHGSEPSAPPCAAAITRSASMTPAIGASTIGNSVLKRSMIRRSGHMVSARFAGGVGCGSGGERIAPPVQYLASLGDDPVNDFGRRRDIMDQPDGFA